MLPFTDEDGKQQNFNRTAPTMPMLSKHLISYTNNKTRIIKTRGKQAAYPQLPMRSSIVCSRTLSYGFSVPNSCAVLLFRGQKHEKIRQQKKNANLVLRLLIRITTENPPAWIIFIIANRGIKLNAVLHSLEWNYRRWRRMNAPSRLLFNSISITLHREWWRCVVRVLFWLIYQIDESETKERRKRRQIVSTWMMCFVLSHISNLVDELQARRFKSQL